MPTPALRSDYTDVRIPGANEYSAVEYNRNAQRTDQAFDWATRNGTVMPAPSGDTSGATDNTALLACQANLPAGRGAIWFWPGVYWLPKDSGNFTSDQHWWSDGGTVLRLAANQNGNFLRTKNWATYITAGMTDIVTATKTVNVPFPGNTITMADTSGIAVGDIVVCQGFVHGTWVTAITTNLSVTCSSAAQYTGTAVTAKFSSVPCGWGIHNMVLDGNGYYGFNIANQLAPPAGLGVTTSGTAGTTFYGYRVTAINAVGETQGCARVSITTGNATLTGTNRNNLSWTAVAGATGYRIYRTKYDVLGAELLLATVGAVTTYQDTSLTDPFGTGISILCPRTNSSGGRVLASWGYGFELENVDIANGAGVGFESTGLPTTNNNFGRNYNTQLKNVHIRANMGGGMRLAGPTDMIWTGADFNSNGTPGSGSANGLTNLDLLTTGLSLTGYHFYGGGVQTGLRCAGDLNTFGVGQMEDGFDYLAFIQGNFNILADVTMYNVSAGVDTPCALYAAGRGNRAKATVQNTAGGIIRFGVGERGGWYEFVSSFWSCARPGTPYLGLPHDTRTVFTDLADDSFGAAASYLSSNLANYELRSAAAKTVPAVDDGIYVVEAAWPYNGRLVPYNNFQWVAVPATSGAAGVAGQQAYDGTYLYTCVTTNTWRRLAHVTW